MAEVASKDVAGTALGLGIAGTVGLVNQLSAANCGLARANDEIACLRNTVCRITQTIVPASAVCPQRYLRWIIRRF